MKKMLSNLGGLVLSREQMKNVNGGKLDDVWCSTKLYWGGGVYTWIEGRCGNNCTPAECEDLAEAAAPSYGAMSGQAYCWPISG